MSPVLRALLVAVVVLALCGTSLAQLFDYFGHQSLVGSSAGGSGSTRDPRGNTGPVVFPPSAPGTETSGVRVGASGYGFVPGPPRGGAHGPFAGGYNSW